MSNSIWHKPGHHPAVGDKAKVSRDGGLIYWTAYGWNRPGEDVHDIGVEWAYVEDVLAQADKAERLLSKVAWLKHNINAWEKVSELKEEYIQRLQKAVDLAVHSFNEICAGVPSDIWVFDEATKATNQIKQLIKEE